MYSAFILSVVLVQNTTCITEVQTVLSQKLNEMKLVFLTPFILFYLKNTSLYSEYIWIIFSILTQFAL